MSKFAKLFDVEQGQVLFVIITHPDEEHSGIQCATKMPDHAMMTEIFWFETTDREESLAQARWMLQEINLESAKAFHEKMALLYSGQEVSAEEIGKAVANTFLQTTSEVVVADTRPIKQETKDFPSATIMPLNRTIH